MSKSFFYFRKTGIIRDINGEYDGDEGYWFEHQVDLEELKNAIVEIVFDSYFVEEEYGETQIEFIKKSIYEFIEDNDFWKELSENYEQELKEYFEDSAFEQFE